LCLGLFPIRVGLPAGHLNFWQKQRAGRYIWHLPFVPGISIILPVAAVGYGNT